MRTPVDAVSAQLAAYNARDLDTFVALYAPAVRLWRMDGTLICEGHGGMRAHYGPYFTANPALKALLLGRLVGGDSTVIDHEWITGRSDGAIVEAFAVFEVVGGLITQVWFRTERRIEAPAG